MGVGVLLSLGIGVGWIAGVMGVLVFMPLGGVVDYTFTEALSNMVMIGFPGFVMLMIALILSLRDDAEDEHFDKPWA